MANNTAKNTVNDTSSSWDSFKMPAGGSARDIRKSVNDLRETITKEKKAFNYMEMYKSEAKLK